jgi:hypothetical protein
LEPLASSHGGRIQTSQSSSIVKITGIAFGWMSERGQSHHFDHAPITSGLTPKADKFFTQAAKAGAIGKRKAA